MTSVRAAYPRSVRLTLLAASALYAIIWLASQSKLIYTDEVRFATDMTLITRGAWTQLVIPHPPLYVMLGSLLTQLFGYTVPVMRIIGGLSFIATLCLIPSACRWLIDDTDRAERASIISLIIYAIHPLALQGSLLLDVDNTIFTPAMLLWVIALVSTESLAPIKRVLIVALCYALMLWTKLLPTPLIITGSILLVYLLRRRLFINTLIGLTLGIIFFLATFVTFASIVHFPIESFTATFQRTGSIASGTSRLLTRAVMGGGITAVWLSIPFLIVYAFLIIRRLIEMIRTRKFAVLDIFYVCSSGGLVLYTIGNELPLGFPRYHYPILVMLVIIVADYLARYRLESKREKYGLAAAVAAAILYFLIVAPDPLLPQYLLTFETNELSQRLIFGAKLQLTQFIIPIGILSIALWIVLKNRSRAMLAAGAAFCIANWSVLSFTQTHADYSTLYEYGRTGAAEASDLVRARTSANDFIIAPLEIIFAADRAGEFLLLDVCPDCTAQQWLDKFESKPPAAYVLTPKEDGRYTQVTRDPQVIALLDRCYTDRATIGSYLIYFRSAGCQE